MISKCTIKINTVLYNNVFVGEKKIRSGRLQLPNIITKKGNVHGKFFLLSTPPGPAPSVYGLFVPSVYARLKRCRIIVLKKYANVCAGGLD